MSGRHTSFATATALANRWVAAHMLSHHLGQHVVELLMAATYTTHAGGCRTTPASPLGGFFAFLGLLAEYPFALRPLVVDVDEELTYGALQEAWKVHGLGDGG